jgi:hypothetical protein
MKHPVKPTPELEFSCDECPAKFSNIQHLWYHEREIHFDPKKQFALVAADHESGMKNPH